VRDGAFEDERTFQLATTPTALAFDPKGQQLAVGGEDGFIRYLVVADKGGAETLTKTLPPRFLSFSPDGRWLASGHPPTDSFRFDADQQSRLQLWDLDKGTSRTLELKGHLSGVAFAPDSQSLALWGSAYQRGKDGEIRLGFVQTFPLALDNARKPIAFKEPVFRVQFHKQTEQITVLLRKNQVGSEPHFLIRRYDRNWQEQEGEGQVQTSFLTVSPAGNEAVSRRAVNGPGGRIDRLVFWDLSQLREQGAREIASKDVAKGSGGFAWLLQEYFPDGNRLALGLESGAVELWDVATRARLASAEASTGRSLSASPVSVSADRLAVLQNGRVNLWAVTDKELKRLRTDWQFPGPIHAIALHPTGSILATANHNGAIYLLRLPKPQE
jgi:WD40 repeat protein